MNAEYQQDEAERLLRDLEKDPANCKLLDLHLSSVYRLPNVMWVGDTAIALIHTHVPHCGDKEHRKKLQSVLSE